ncbi:hypothetical protein AKJ40_03720 [candidate division MSBL1 archaeon SCGC-AAA259M10]|uniref:MmgE/PrpD family protein n=1 Tax=candidate division MSBL1 archaeon SCGC-AAA259M10 TaxID=1698270 RepID=A0A133UYB5_9EURY|nr:hypothetical protein AKJ40_03720 [candidate division MSBL1 archaeon SCGC-AAA259M10]
MMNYISEKLTNFAKDTTFKDIPKEVREKVKLHLLDSLGIGIRGHNSTPVNAVFSAFSKLNTTDEGASVILGDRKFRAPTAAMINGTHIHSLDFDDTELEGCVHLSTCAVPSALSVGEENKASGKEIISAITVGYETMIRLGMAAPWEFHDRGMHATPFCGIFASALIAGKLMELEKSEMVNALGICGSMVTPSAQQFLVSGEPIKCIHPGIASKLGILAAIFSREGLEGPDEIFEGSLGIYKVFLGENNYSLEKLTEGLNRKWKTLDISVKTYPSCHITHSYMDCTNRILKRQDLSPKDIKEIVCVVEKTPSKVVCEPIEEKRKPKTGYGAKFSVPYCVSLVMHGKGKRVKDFEDRKVQAEKSVKDTASKVRCDTRPEIEGGLPGWVIVETINGDKFEEKQKFPKGHPKNPITEKEILEKFEKNTEKRFDKKERTNIVDKVKKLEKTEDINSLTKLLEIR